jgi:hypothetical protein
MTTEFRAGLLWDLLKLALLGWHFSFCFWGYKGTILPVNPVQLVLF